MPEYNDYNLRNGNQPINGTYSNTIILSPTQIDTFLTCPRKWAFKYRDRIEPPPSPSAEFGKRVHLWLEQYLSGGQSLNINSEEGRVATPGLSFLPDKNIAVETEKHITFTRKGISYQGYIDFCYQDGSTFVIGDHKTTSSLRLTLGVNELPANTQAALYAHWAFSISNAERIRLRWIYYRTKGKAEAKLVEADCEASDIAPALAIIDEIASEMIEAHHNNLMAKHFVPNVKACFKYGPCPFLYRCRSTPLALSTVAAIMEKNMNSEKPKPQKKGFNLYVDCYPTKMSEAYDRIIDVSELLKPVQEKLCQEKQLAHYRLAGYGQHVGFLASYLRNHLNEQNFNNIAITTTTKSAEGCDSLTVLSEMAEHIVRAI